MPFNVLLLPLLGGYIFLTHWNRTRFHTKRYSGERLIFHSASAGVVFLLLSFLVVRSLIFFLPEWYTGWRSVVPFPYTGTSFGAFLLGAVVWIPLNWIFRLDKEQRLAIAELGDHLEELLEWAIRETRQVSISTKAGKVYVGFVTSNIEPAYDRKFIRILPVSSGYRDPTTQEVVFTTDYAHVYDQMIFEKSDFGKDGPDQFQIILPVGEITSANLFDPEAYTRFQTAPPITAGPRSIELV